MSRRAMQAEPQISAHEIGPPFSSSGGAMIHRLCRVKLPGGFAPISLFAQGFVTRYSELLAVWIAITKGDFQCKKHT